MQRPMGEASSPQYRHRPPAPVPSPPPPRMMAVGRPYPSPPSLQVRGLMMSPPPPFSPTGQQSHRFGPPPASPKMAPGNAMPPSPRQAIAGSPAPPPSILTSSSASVPHPSVPPPPPPQMVRASGMIPLGQHHPLPSLPLNSCPPPQFPQGLNLPAHTAPALPVEPTKPKDDEVIRNIEVLTQFVVKNGSGFESLAQAKQAGNPKFSFLFGGEPGSDAAIGQEYYRWFKMKCQLEKSACREVEAKSQTAVPSKSVGFNQHMKDSNAVSSEGLLPGADASDMEMDMDMEDDIALPKSVKDDGKDFETTDRKDGEHHLTVGHPKAECRETLVCQVTGRVAAGGKHFEASQLEFQKGKGKILDTTLELPCVEDVSPVRPMPKEMHQNLTIEKSGVKSVSTVCNPPVASTAMEESKVSGSSHVVEAGSEIAGFPENTSVKSISHEDMEYKKREGFRHCYNSRSVTDGLFCKNSKEKFHSTNKNISLDQDNVKSNIDLEANSLKPDIALVTDNLISEVGLHGKLEELPGKVDKYGRVIRKSGSDSESNDTKEVRDARWSRSPSPRYERRRKRSYSKSPRRNSRWSRSHSRSPKRRRSRSRTPLHEFRRGGDPRYDRISRRRGTPPLCNDFAKGKCYRGASCRFLHEEISGDDVSRWDGGRRVKGRSGSRHDTTMPVGAKDGHFFGELDKSKRISPDRYFDGHDNRNLGERRTQDFEGQNSHNFGERKNQVFDVHDNLDSEERKSHDFYDNHNFGERKNLDDGYDKCNFGERKNQEHYRISDHSNNPCFNFLKGRCYRGASCKYLHSETTTDSSGRWYGVGKGRETMENRQDIRKSYGGRDNFEGDETEKPKINSPNRLSDEHYKHNIRDKRIQDVDRTHGRSVAPCIFFARGVCQRGSSCRFLHEDVSGDNVDSRGRGRSKSRVDVQDIPDLIRQRSQESQKHNDSSADTVMYPQFVTPFREKSQPHREELWASSLTTVDAPPQHNHKGNLEHLRSTEGLNSKAVLEGNVGQPPVSEGSTDESYKIKLEPVPVENSDLHPNVNSDLTPHHFLPQDLPSLHNHSGFDHSLMFRQAHECGGLSLSENDGLKGTSPSQLNTKDKADLLPCGSPTNSSTMYPLSGITACAMTYERDSVASPPSLVPQPVSEHSKYVEVKHSANVSTDMVTDCTGKKSPRLQTTMETVLHFTGIREQHPAPMSTTIPFLPMQNKSGQDASAPLVEHYANAFGKMATASIDQRTGYSHTSLESLSHVSNTDQEGVAQRPTTIPHFASETKSGQSASAFGEQKMSSFSNCAGPSTLSLSAISQPIKDMLARGDLHNHLSGSIEHSSATKHLLNKVSDSANVQDTKEITGEPDKIILQNNACLVNKVSHVKPSSPSSTPNISINEKNKDALESSLMETVLHQSVHGDTQASSSMLENRSPACEGKNWNPGAGTEGGADIDTEHALDESKKSKEIKAIKQFRTVIAEFVKEELKPTWREGHMSKESFKTIVKKVVDKVAGSLQVHQIPRTQERIDQYIAASRPKLTKLIQGYVEKYVKS